MMCMKKGQVPEMKQAMRKSISVALILTLCLSIIGVFSVNETFAASKTHINSATVKMNVGNKCKLTLFTQSGKTISPSKIKWRSTNKSVATVSKGVITAKKAGKTTIKATYKGKTYNCRCTVLKNPLRDRARIVDQKASEGLDYEKFALSEISDLHHTNAIIGIFAAINTYDEAIAKCNGYSGLNYVKSNLTQANNILKAMSFYNSGEDTVGTYETSLEIISACKASLPYLEAAANELDRIIKGN